MRTILKSQAKFYFILPILLASFSCSAHNNGKERSSEALPIYVDSTVEFLGWHGEQPIYRLSSTRRDGKIVEGLYSLRADRQRIPAPNLVPQSGPPGDTAIGIDMDSLTPGLDISGRDTTVAAGCKVEMETAVDSSALERVQKAVTLYEDGEWPQDRFWPTAKTHLTIRAVSRSQRRVLHQLKLEIIPTAEEAGYRVILPELRLANLSPGRRHIAFILLLNGATEPLLVPLDAPWNCGGP